MSRATGRPRLLRSALAGAAMIAVFATLGGCATTGDNPADPWEGFNRHVYAFNKGFDRMLAKPVAKAYNKYTPEPLNIAISNFFGNLADVRTAVNNALQLKLLAAFEDAGRITFNSTFGLGGLIDFASGVGFAKHDEDFGQTLGRWGVKPGPYIVIPILGPSTVRDAAGRLVDTVTLDPVFYITDTPVEVATATTRAVDTRADLLKTERIIEKAALDEYNFVRDGYLQRRRSQVYDGNPPPE